MWINFLHSRPEALRGASCAKIHFIHCLGSSCQANIRLNASLLQPRVYFLNEIVNRERAESGCITHVNTSDAIFHDNCNHISILVQLFFKGFLFLHMVLLKKTVFANYSPVHSVRYGIQFSVMSKTNKSKFSLFTPPRPFFISNINCINIYIYIYREVFLFVDC